MGDEHLSTIPETKSNEVIKSSVENLFLIPSESEGNFDDTCDVPFCDNSPPLDVLNNHFNLFFDSNDDCTSSDDDSFEDIDYVEASALDSKLVSLEDVKDDILHKKLLNINLLIAKIESLNDNSTPDWKKQVVAVPLLMLITLFPTSLDFCSKEKMSRDVLTVGSTMRIPLLYQGEYSQWVKKFMNYLEEQTNEEAMINSIKNGDQPLPHVTQVFIVGTSSTEQHPLKDKSMWKAVVLYKYETFKATEGELLLDTYKNVNDAMGLKKKTVVVTSDPLDLIAKKTKEGHFAKDCKKEKLKDYNYYKTKMLLAKKNSYEQVLLAEDQAWMESSSDSDKEINADIVFMAQIEKVLSVSDEISLIAEETIAEII
nr:hypothetical protein [Tanacetum cinerariifolium]